MVVKELHEERNWPICRLCSILNVSTQGYYKWLKKVPSKQEKETRQIAEILTAIHMKNRKIYGYRRMTVAVNKKLNTKYNPKRIRRIMRILDLYSVIRRPRPSWQRSNPVHLAENILNRSFDSATAPNQIWCTDVTECKYGKGQKEYLSAIIDLFDKSIVAYILSPRNDNAIVMETVRKAFEANKGAQPLIHSDRGFQYTSHAYKALRDEFTFTVSMSRVSKCLDNQPIESFWGTLKAECYYLNTYETREDLISDIEKYIHFYNHERITLKNNGLTPIEIREKAIA